MPVSNTGLPLLDSVTPALLIHILGRSLLERSCRYNLFREDSEGYAKLITLLGHFGSGHIGINSVTAEVWPPIEGLVLVAALIVLSCFDRAVYHAI